LTALTITARERERERERESSPHLTNDLFLYHNVSLVEELMGKKYFANVNFGGTKL
jgi:hypothetical protein